VPRLLVVHHTPSPATHDLLLAVLEGARDPAVREAGVEVEVHAALAPDVPAALGADGYLLGTPANLGTISGALKHWFDTVYYPCLEATRGRPYGLWVHGQGDTTGAVRTVERIVTGLGWRAAAEPLSVIGPPAPSDLSAARDLGATLAATLVI
jgi:multimeric flavodoxin WrbA